MAEKNRQHYVPKLYLRNFTENKHAISTYNITNLKYIPNASIKNMCQKHNFYGADNKLENYLNDEFETKTAPIIKNIIETNQLPAAFSGEYNQLIMFILVSEARNLKLADSFNSMFDFLMKTVISKDPSGKEIDLDSFNVELTGSPALSIQTALESTPLILDLKPLLIIENSGGRKFITSDNPVIRYNSFYKIKNYMGGIGYISRGLQLFFPLSPKHCLLLYDEHAYDIPEVENNILILRRARDVDQLNELIYLNAYNNIFFHHTTKIDYVNELYYKNRRTPKIGELGRETAAFKSVQSNNEIIHYSPNRVTKKFNFPWMKLSNWAQGLRLPAHAGGLNREESHFISEFLKRERDGFAKDPGSPRDNLYIRK